MATIKLYKSKINNMPNTLSDLRSEIDSYNLELKSFSAKLLAVTNPILDKVISKISTASRSQEEQVNCLNEMLTKIDDFVAAAQRIDNNVADYVRGLGNFGVPFYRYTRFHHTGIKTYTLNEYLSKLSKTNNKVKRYRKKQYNDTYIVSDYIEYDYKNNCYKVKDYNKLIDFLNKESSSAFERYQKEYLRSLIMKYIISQISDNEIYRTGTLEREDKICNDIESKDINNYLKNCMDFGYELNMTSVLAAAGPIGWVASFFSKKNDEIFEKNKELQYKQAMYSLIDLATSKEGVIAMGECIVKGGIGLDIKDSALEKYQSSRTYLKQMFDKFCSGSGGVYTSKELTDAVRENQNTKKYVEQTKNEIVNALSNHDSATSDDVKKILIDKFGYRDNNFDIKATGNIDPLNYGFGDSGGLSIAIHDWNSKHIELVDYSTDGKHFKGKIKYVFEDTFGLDSKDIKPENFKEKNQLVKLLPAFQAWYILQHDKAYNGKYKPFTTRVEIEEDFEGDFK